MTSEQLVAKPNILKIPGKVLRKAKVAGFTLYKTVNALALDTTPLRELSRFHGTDVIKMEGFMRQGQYRWFEELFDDNDIRHVGETGFNGGHSSFAFANFGAESVTSFDIGEHQYVYPAFDYVNARFPDTEFKLELGDSRKTVPRYLAKVAFDLVFIDGGHSCDVASADVRNMQALASKSALVVVDDYTRPGPKTAYNEAVNEGIIDHISTEYADLRGWAFGRYT